MYVRWKYMFEGNYKTKPTRTKCNREFWKIYNSFSIVSVDITRHANSRTHAKRTFFRTERPLHAKLYKTVEKKTVTWRIMTAGPLENKRGEPSLVEKKIHEELKQLRVRPPADGRLLRPLANKFANAFDSMLTVAPLTLLTTSGRDSYCAAAANSPLSYYTPLKIRWLRWENSLRILLYVSGRIALHSSLKCE